MSGFPEGWESDYDGKRWFYRYKPTGLVQYTFPQPGDEFPSFVEDGAPPVSLAPEERLVSQQQLKRKSTVGEASAKPRRVETKAGPTSATLFEQDDGGGDPWLQPDIFMYMGPGAYTDISPLQEEEEPTPDTKKTEEPTALPSPPAPTAADVSPQKSPPQPGRSKASPIVSAVTTPLVVDSKPVTATPEIDSGVVVEAGDGAPAKSATPTPPTVAPAAPSLDRGVVVEAGDGIPAKSDTLSLPSAGTASREIVGAAGDGIPLLDSREVRFSPVGFVAELASEFTAQCHEEIHPAPVELPGNEILMEVEKPVVYANAFPLAPVELHSDALPPSRVENRDGVEQKTLSFRERALDAQRERAGTNGSSQDTPDPYRPPIRQSTMPQPGHAPMHSSDAGKGSTLGKYVPYNPAMRFVPPGEESSRVSDATGANKRHSLAGPPPSSWKPSDVPASLSPPIPLKKQQDSVEEANRPGIPEHGRPESISDPIRHPSVLQPARGRPKIVQFPPPNPQPSFKQRVDADQVYQAYKPTRDLQKEIEDTVEMLSKTSYGPQPPAPLNPSDSGRPTVSRTSTLPADLPTIPFFGVRPQMPPSAPSAPAALRNVQSHQTFSHQHHTSITGGGEVSRPAFLEYTAPLPPSSPDVPQPLKLSRKSPPPGSQNNLPTVTSSLRPRTPTEAYIVSRETTPAPPENPVVSGPAMDTPNSGSNVHSQPAPSQQQPPVSAPQTTTQSQVPHPSAQHQRPETATSFGVLSSEPVTQAVAHCVSLDSQTTMQSQPPRIEGVASFSVTSEPLSQSVPLPVKSIETTSAQPEVRKQSWSTNATTVHSIDRAPTVPDSAQASGANASPPNVLDPGNIPLRESSLPKQGKQSAAVSQQPASPLASGLSHQDGHPAPPQPPVPGRPDVAPQALHDSRIGTHHLQTPPKLEGYGISPGHAAPAHGSRTSPKISDHHGSRESYGYMDRPSVQQAPPTPPPKLPHEVSPQSIPSQTTSPKPHRGSISDVIAQEQYALSQRQKMPPPPGFVGQHGYSAQGSPSLSSHQQSAGPTPSPPIMPYASQPSAPLAPYRTYTSYTPPGDHNSPPSHLATVSQFPPPGAPMPIRPGHLPPDDSPSQRSPFMPPFQYSLRNDLAQSPPSMGLSGQPPPRAVPTPNSLPQPMYNSSHGPPMSGPPAMGPMGQLPLSRPPFNQPQFPGTLPRQAPPMGSAPGRPPSMPIGPGQAQRKLSLQNYGQPSTQQPNQPPTGKPGTAPPKRFSMFSPPSIVPAHMSGGHLQATRPDAPATLPQNMPPQQVRPAQAETDVRPNSNSSSGTLTMQSPQSIPPLQEEKGSFFGRLLLRSDSKKKSLPSTGNKLQKANPQMGSPLSQSQLSSSGGSPKPIHSMTQVASQPPGAAYAPQPNPTMHQFQHPNPLQQHPSGPSASGGTRLDLYAQHQPIVPSHIRPQLAQLPSQQRQYSQPQQQPQQRKQSMRQVSGPGSTTGGPLYAAAPGEGNGGTGRVVSGASNGHTSASGQPSTLPSAYDGTGWGDDDDDY